MHADLSYHGRLAAKRGQLDNGQLPHGGYKGSKRHPPSPISLAHGVDFQQNLDKGRYKEVKQGLCQRCCADLDTIGQEIQRLLWEKENLPNGSSPTWSILVHNEPSYTDESPLIINNLLAASKLEPSSGIYVSNRSATESITSGKPNRGNRRMYYRPNSTHQFLSATDLKDCSQNSTCRPTRTTLLRNLQRRNSASANLYQTRRDFLHRLSEIRNSYQVRLTTESLKFETTREGEPLHSFLTGTRYNRYNPALGCCFTPPREQTSRQKYEDFASRPPTPNTPELRPRFDFKDRFRPATAPHQQPTPSVKSPEPFRSSYHFKDTPLKLSVIGSNIPVSKPKSSNSKLPSHFPRSENLLKQYKFSVEETLRNYGYLSTSSISELNQDVTSLHDSSIKVSGKSNSEMHVDSPRRSVKLNHKMTHLKNNLIASRIENNKIYDASVKVFSLSSKRISVSSNISTPVCVPTLNQNACTPNSVHEQQTGERETDEELTNGTTLEENFEKVLHDGNENDTNVHQDLFGDGNKIKSNVNEILDQKLNNERDDSYSRNREDADEDSAEESNDNLSVNDINCVNENNELTNDVTKSSEHCVESVDDSDRPCKIKELNEEEGNLVTNLSEIEEDSTAVVTNFLETAKGFDSHVVNLLATKEYPDVKIINKSKTEQDPGGHLLNLAETEQDPDGHLLNLSETEQDPDGHLLNLSETEDDAEGHLLNLAETEDDAEGHLLNLAETEDDAEGHLLNLAETEDDAEGHLLNLSETEDDAEGHFLNLAETEDDAEGHLLNLAETEDDAEGHFLNLAETEEGTEGHVPNLSETENGRNKDETEIDGQQKHHSVRFFITEENVGTEYVVESNSHKMVGNDEKLNKDI